MTDHRPFIAIALMIGAVSVNAVKDGLSKMLAPYFLPNQILWTQLVFTLLILLPMIIPRHGWRVLLPRPFGLQVLRGLYIVVGVGCFYWSVRYIPLADATALVFMAPLVVTALSPLILGEQVGWRSWVAVAVGFVGVLLILRPDFSGDRTGYYIAFVCGVSIGFFYMGNRQLAGHTPALVGVAYAMMVGVVVLAPSVPFTWRNPPAEAWPILVPFYILSTLGQLMMITAFRFAPATVIAPFQYPQLIVATIFGFIVFGGFPDAYTWSGIALIVGAGLFIALRERRKQRAGAETASV